MVELPVPLSVAILDADVVSSNVLKAIVEIKERVIDVNVFRKTADVDDAFHSNKCNSLFIDIFSLGIYSAIDFVDHIRNRYPTVPICLYAMSSMLEGMPGVNKHWRNRFDHYYKLEKDQTIQELNISVEQSLYLLSSWMELQQAEFTLKKAVGSVNLHGQDDPEEFEESILSLEELLDIYRRTLLQYIKQRAMQGTAFVSPNIEHGIQDARKNIDYIKYSLREWGQFVPDHPYDEKDPI